MFYNYMKVRSVTYSSYRHTLVGSVKLCVQSTLVGSVKLCVQSTLVGSVKLCVQSTLLAMGQLEPPLCCGVLP